MFRFLPIFFLIVSCESSSRRSASRIEVTASACPSHWLVTATNASFDSSSLFLVDPCSGERRLLQEGLSGDAVLFSGKSLHYLVNRSVGMQSIRTIDVHSDFGNTIHFDVSDEISWQELAIGDPHSLVELNSEELLVVNYTDGGLKIFNLRDRSWTSIAPSLDGFKLEDATMDSKGRLLVLAQGYDASYRMNGQQSLFVLEKSFSWKVVKRIKLKVSVPDRIHIVGDQAYLLGLCSNSEGCISGQETIDLERLTVEDTKVIPSADYRYFGKSAFDVEKKTFYFSCVLKDRTKHVMQWGTDDPPQSVFTFPDVVTSGYWALEYDRARRKLMIGDAEGNGVFHVVDGPDRISFQLSLAPYSLVPLKK